MKQHYASRSARLALALAALLVSGAATASGADIPFTGAGTAESPYLIQNKADLISLSKLSIDEGETFSGKYIKLTADIDLQHSEDFKGICVGIGTSSAPAGFAGVFDGDGHTIDNMYFKHTVWSQEPTATELGKVTTSGAAAKKYQGLFGSLAEEGVVKNVTVGSGTVFEGYGNSAPIVGYSNGTVENCVNNADVLSYADSQIGGIVGYAYYKSVIRNCVNNGTVTCGSSKAGGIVGYNWGLISGCINTGTVTGRHMVDNVNATSIAVFGGIAGYTCSRVENCVNYGAVMGPKTIGGIIGQIQKSTSKDLVNPNDVIHNLSVGAVIGGTRSEIGAIAGSCRVVSKVEGNVWDSQIAPMECIGSSNLTEPGGTGMETAILTSGTDVTGLDVTAMNFSAGNYPAVASLVSLECVKTARGTYLTIPAGKSVKNLLGLNVTLSSANGLTWKLSGSQSFKISGNTLQCPASVTRLTTDTLTASANGITKLIEVQARPPMSLQGTGTEQDPYIISSTDDWTSLSYFISDAENDLEGKFVKLTAGLDFWGEDFRSLACDGFTMFNGTFLGNNKLIEGIELENTADFLGLFGYIGPQGHVKDLTVEGSVSLIGNKLTGAFAGESYGTIENCVNKLSIVSVHDNKSNGGTNTGGFVGNACDNAKFVKCVNKAQIYAEQKIGGFAGAIKNDSYVTFTECVNEGQIVSALGTSNSSGVAGFAGYAYPCAFYDCVNKGEVKVTRPNQVPAAGGFIGYALTSKADTIRYVFKRCHNEGNITACKNVGGLVGEVNSSIVPGRGIMMVDSCSNSGTISGAAGASQGQGIAGLISSYTPGSVITNCLNSGNIVGNKSTYVGGIVGKDQKAATAAYPVVIKNCRNTGNVSSSLYYAGGIISYLNNYVTVDSCYNTGTVTCDQYNAGGIVSNYSSASGTAVRNCWNTGTVRAQNKVGGIVGSNASAAATVINCWNGGLVESTAANAVASGSTGCYAVGGICGQAASTITRCFNAGTVKGVGGIGGIVGLPVANKTKIKDCVNAGIIDCPADTCGYILGISTEANGKLWKGTNEISNCAYVTDFGNKADLSNEGVVGLKAAELCALDPVEGSVKIGDYCLPVPEGLADDDATKLFATLVVLNEADSLYSNITKDFFVGAPAGVTWTSSLPSLAISGNDCKFGENYSGDVVLTGTIGDFTRTFALKADGVISGIIGIHDENLDGAGKAEYYDLQGRRLAKPGKGVTIRRTANGTSKVIR